MSHVLPVRRVLLSVAMVLLLAIACNTKAVPTLPQVDTREIESTDAISLENVEHITQIARWERGAINALAYAPDGRTLAVATSVGIHLYDTVTLTELLFIDTETWVTCVAFAPDGETLASGSRYPNNAVELWQVSNGALLRVLEGHTYSVTSLAFAPDGRVLASGSSDDTVRLWDVENGELLNVMEAGQSSCIDTVCGVTNVAVAPNGQIVASGMLFGGAVRLWRASDGALLRELKSSENDDDVAFTPDSETLISWSYGGPVHLWRVVDGVLVDTLEGPVGDKVAVNWSGEVLASEEWGYPDWVVRLWKMSDGSLLHSLEGHTNTVAALAFAPDGQTLASGSRDGTVRIWRVRDGTLLGVLDEYASCGVAHSGCGISSLAPAPDSQTLASGNWNGTVQLRRMSDGILLWEHRESWAVVTAMAFSPNGDILATGSGQGEDKVRLWRSSDGELVRVLQCPEVVSVVTFSPDGRVLAAGLFNNRVQLWQVSDGTLLHTLEHPEKLPHSVQSVAFAPDGQTIASSIGHEIRVWRVSDGELLHIFEPEDFASRLAFMTDGQALALLSRNTLRLWRMSDDALAEYMLESPFKFGRPETYLNMWSANLDPNWQMLAAGSSDGMIWLWGVSDGRIVRTLEGHTASVADIGFTADGRFLVSGAEDGTIRLWGIAP
jgi:WD40 repeat protein